LTWVCGQPVEHPARARSATSESSRASEIPGRIDVTHDGGILDLDTITRRPRSRFALRIESAAVASFLHNERATAADARAIAVPWLRNLVRA